MIYICLSLFYLPRITFSCKIFQKRFALQMNRTVFSVKCLHALMNHFIKQMQYAIKEDHGMQTAAEKANHNNCSVETGPVTTVCFSFGYSHDGSNALSSFHEVDGIVDLLQIHFVGYKLIKHYFARHVVTNQFRN